MQRDHLIATERTAPAGRTPEVFRDAQLTGTVIILKSQVDGHTVMHELTIANVDLNNLKYWAGDLAGTSEIVPAFEIVSRRFGDPCPPVHICQQNVGAEDPIWQKVEHSAIVFEGDRYDPDAKTVSDSTGTTWFNLACAATAPAKMHLMRHTSAGAFNGDTVRYQTAIAERDAMLKMFTADYCGTGTLFTHDGQPLDYGDSQRWFPATPELDLGGRPIVQADGMMSTGGRIEALWNEHGALCLDQPRVVDRSAVAAKCAIQPCTGVNGLFTTGGALPPWHVISGLVAGTPLASALPAH